MLYLALIFALGIGLLVLIINLPIHPAVKFILGIGAMFGISKMLGSQLKIKDDYGMLMLRSQAGIGVINRLAKNEKFWNVFADIGTVLAYGAASFFIIKRPIKERAIVMFLGLILLSLISFFVAPYVFPFLLTKLGGEIGASTKAIGGGITSLYLLLGFIYIGGFALVSFASLVSYTAIILSAIVGTYLFGTLELDKTAPGATFILPGINIPFAEGVIALAIVLLVHEMAHAILSRIAKVRILSSGIVLFGVLPIGAFVEPDEEMLMKIENKKQTRVLIAGSTANLFTAGVFFVLFLGFIFASAPYKENGLLVVGGNMSGNIIYTINGQDATTFVKNASNKIKYNDTLTIESNKGKYNIVFGEGKLKYYDLSSSFFIAKYKNWLVEFIYNFLGLAFSLNFVIGMVNLLPLPFFDGYRLLETNVNNKMLVNAVAAIAALGFIVNFLPWVL